MAWGACLVHTELNQLACFLGVLGEGVAVAVVFAAVVCQNPSKNIAIPLPPPPGVCPCHTGAVQENLWQLLGNPIQTLPDHEPVQSQTLIALCCSPYSSI